MSENAFSVLSHLMLAGVFIQVLAAAGWLQGGFDTHSTPPPTHTHCLTLLAGQLLGQLPLTLCTSPSRLLCNILSLKNPQQSLKTNMANRQRKH